MLISLPVFADLFARNSSFSMNELIDSEDTVKSWKTRYQWERDKPVKKANKTAHNAHKSKSVCKRVQEPEEELSDKGVICS